VPTAFDESGFDRVVRPLIESAAERNPDFAASVVRLAGTLRDRMRGVTLPVVFQHGDFKVENAIYEPGTCRLLSVIDWEHARRPGLPVLDLLYLLVYNRIIRGADAAQAIDELIVQEAYTGPERERLQRYLSALGLDQTTLPSLRALFLVHHVGCRIHLPADPKLRAKFGEMLNGLRRIMAEPV